MSDFKQTIGLYDQLRANRDRTKPLWDSISQYVGIGTDPDYAWNGAKGNKSEQLDQYVDDPTAAISVNQAGDYLMGIMWGTGENVLSLVPSKHVEELIDPEALAGFYKYASSQTLYHLNHPEAGYQTALRPYAYDQVAFGTSGIGLFVNRGFKEGRDEHALVARNYGVDNVVIDEGKSGMVDFVFATYNWRVNRIVSEFAMKDGAIDEAKLATLPKQIKDAYTKKNVNDTFDIVFGMSPNEMYNPRLKGKKGARYRGVWFFPDKTDASNDKYFMEEFFNERPINMARMIRIRGDVWGRASGTMLISSIRSVNYMISTSIEVMEKMADPALGVMSNAVFGDNVLDTSPSGLTVFNSTLAQGNPTFPLYDVGDPTNLVKFLVPYLNEKITTAFKIDVLLDFASSKEMTATESMQRFVIRGQSLSGVLTQQKNERAIPDVKRAVSILTDLGEIGVNPKTDAERASRLTARNLTERIIPDEVLQVMDSGKPWYEIHFNNELEKLIRTEKVQSLLQILNAIGAIAGLYPEIVLSVDWYKLLKDINDNLDANNQVMFTKAQFDGALAKIEEAKAAALQMQLGREGAATAKDATSAQKNVKESEAINAAGR